MSDDAWDVRPFEGLAGVVPGGLRLGERRSVLAARLADELGERLGERRTFRKAAWQTGLCDHYIEGGLILFFDDRDRLCYVELCEDAPVTYDGVWLLGRPYGEVVADLRSRGCRLVEGDVGCEAPDAGFNLTAVDPQDPARPVDCVGVFVNSPADGVVGMSDEEPVESVTEHRLVSMEGTEAVRLGQDRRELRGLLGPALQSRPDYGGETRDWYLEHGLVLTFDAADRLVSLVVHYAIRGGTAWFRGVQLLDRPYAEVVAELEAQGVRVEPAELGGRVPDHGFALYLRGLQNPSMPIAAVAFTDPLVAV
ncbi:hypothetical protein [Actinomadura sp. HBU206391]|uniref:hypothetical protein n=1 Tax=Actinomadura sp. HBU206391 TaxID=2731692 RepID=UPI00164FC9A4|nr:hypothetical protein [Actinomadura sp. HBU206391]MBC6456681.1 hypothetical protein [Actinomadura sp. HBU206391]